MSNVIPNEQPLTTSDLTDLIDIKLTQANAVCNVARMAKEAHTDDTMSYALWAATDLIEEAQKAFEELIRLEKPPRAAQS